MKTIAIVSRKGGAGKSTIAAHLSVLASKPDMPALIVDTDPQGSLAFWHEQREAEAPVLVKADTKDLPEILEAARADGIAWALIDSAPHLDSAIARVVAVADLCLIPTRAAMFDLAAVSDTVRLIEANAKPALAVLNASPPRRGMENPTVTEARKVLEGMGVDVFAGAISQRVSFQHALTAGTAVTEYEPTGPAAKEMSRLWAAIQEKVNP